MNGHARGLDPGGERIVDRVRTWEFRQQGRMDVDDAVGKTLEEPRRQQVHVPRQHHQVDSS